MKFALKRSAALSRLKWAGAAIVLLAVLGFDTRNPFRTRGPFRAASIGASSFGPCTDTVDCYCDRVTNPSDPYYDASVLSCEDFENPNFYSTTDLVSGSGGSTTFYRGDQSDWYADYGQPDFLSSATYSVPTAPRIFNRCFSGTPGAVCAAPLEYCSTAQGNLVDGGGADCWGPGVNSVAVMDIQRSGDFSAENGALTLTGGSGETGDVGAGNTHFAYRIPTSGGSSTGVGHERFSLATEVGITMAHAYSSNLAATGITSQPWKHEEWAGNSSGYSEFWNLGNTGYTTGTDYFPYMPVIWVNNNCASALAGATVHVGAAHCIGTGGSGVSFALGMTAQGNATFPIDGPDTEPNSAWKSSGVTNYFRPTDFPYGTWKCHRAHISGMGTTNVTIKIWHGANLVFHMSGFNGSSAMQNSGYDDFWWNAYSNKMIGSGISEVAYRYRDNVHIRAGAPVACSQIGF